MGHRKRPHISVAFLAGAERIELPSKVLETPILPLYDAPMILYLTIIPIGISNVKNKFLAKIV